jgi:type IV secretion system protein TrbE
MGGDARSLVSRHLAAPPSQARVFFRVSAMIDLRPFQQRGAKLSDYLLWAALVAPGVILNKDGAFQRTLAFRGPDLDSSTPSELIGAANRINNALRRFGSGWCLHVEARRAPAPGYPDASWPDALSWLIDEERRAVFETAGARFESSYFLTLTRLPPPERQGKLEGVLFEGGESQRALGVDYQFQLDRFLRESDQFMALLETLMPEAHWLSDEETLSYLHDCVSDRSHLVAVPQTPFHLDALLPDAPLVGGLEPKLGAKHLRIISVRSFVTETEPGLLDHLNRLAISYRWVTRFLPLDREEGRKQLEIIRKRWFSKRKGLLTLLREALFREETALLDNDATNQTADADAALQELGADGVAAGYATLTITIAEQDETLADETVRQVQQVADGLGFVTQVESVNAIEAWLGSLPGQGYADMRRPILLTPSLAHLLPVSAVWAGPVRNSHLGAAPLMLTATDGATPFRLDLHVGDVGHTLVVGPTGAGKSVLLATLAAQWLRYPSAQVYIFDKGRSARATVLGLGGDFFDLGEAGALGLQPLECIDDANEAAWALDWVIALLSAAGVKVGPERRAELWRSLEILSQRSREERTLTLFAALVQDHELRAALQPYTHAGPYGRLLDLDQPSLRSAQVQAFEMDDLMKKPAAIGPVLGALFHVLERRFDGAPSLLVLDEAWLFLKDSAFAAQIQDWLKTLRKRNVAVIFASQELADVEASPIASTIIEACLTRIYLPNDRAREPRSRAFYEGLGLNGRQIELIANATPKRDYYVASRNGCRLFELGLGPAALAFVAASRPEDHQIIDAVIEKAGAQGFAAAWLDARGPRDAASAVRRFDCQRNLKNEAAPAALAVAK